MEKRTNIDWSQHELIIKQDNLCKIHWLKKPDTVLYNVKFIHVEGILIVMGDFGRWSFCRDFDPDNFDKTGVSDSYWCEKIRLGSEQTVSVFDYDTAQQSIQEKIEELLENSETDRDGNVCFEDSREQEEYDFWNDLSNNCCDEFELITCFRENKPDSIDFEDFPCCKIQNRRLDAIFDAFEEISRRLSTKNSDGVN